MPDITITGIDARTNLDAIMRLHDAYPGFEVGILLSLTPEGRHRYPSVPWIENTLAKLGAEGVLTSVHICGSVARRQLFLGALDSLLAHTPTIQVNGCVSKRELISLTSSDGHVIITQHKNYNASLADVDVDGHCLLVDDSGGKGLSPSRWVRPKTSKLVGFAGGLGPDNIADELSKIAAAADGHDWFVDMEGKLRDNDDFFSVEKASMCIIAFNSFMG